MLRIKMQNNASPPPVQLAYILIVYILKQHIYYTNKIPAGKSTGCKKLLNR
jgi:hypothetical protein